MIKINIKSIMLDLDGGYAEVNVCGTSFPEGEETARTLVKHGFIVSRIKPDGYP